MITAKAKNGAYQVAKISIKCCGLLEAFGSTASYLNASWLDSNNSDCTMLSIPPMSANGRLHFLIHSRTMPILRWADILMVLSLGPESINFNVEITAYLMPLLKPSWRYTHCSWCQATFHLLIKFGPVALVYWLIRIYFQYGFYLANISEHQLLG